jgi:hypothetical protein
MCQSHLKMALYNFFGHSLDKKKAKNTVYKGLLHAVQGSITVRDFFQGDMPADCRGPILETAIRTRNE